MEITIIDPKAPSVREIPAAKPAKAQGDAWWGGEPAWDGWSGQREAWWRQVFRVRRGQLSMSAQGRFHDEDLRGMVAFLNSSQGLPTWRQEHRHLMISELDLGTCNLTDVVIPDLIAAVLEHNVALRGLKLHKNKLTSSSAAPLKQLLERGTGAMKELHLSHNCLGDNDARSLILAAASRKEYPLSGAGPLWLRVEQQQAFHLWPDFVGSAEHRRDVGAQWLSDLSEEVAELRRKHGYLPKGPRGPMLCVPEKPKDGCNTGLCQHQHAYGPVVHVPYFWRQGPGWKGGGRLVSASAWSQDSWKSSTWQCWPQPSEQSKPDDVETEAWEPWAEVGAKVQSDDSDVELHWPSWSDVSSQIVEPVTVCRAAVPVLPAEDDDGMTVTVVAPLSFTAELTPAEVPIPDSSDDEASVVSADLFHELSTALGKGGATT